MIRQRGKSSFQIRFCYNGIRQEETIRGTLKDAERELAKRLGSVASGAPIATGNVLFGELAVDMIRQYQLNNYRSMDDVEARFRVHIIPVLGSRKATSITTADLSAYTAMRKDAGAKPGTINRELEAIRRAFKLGMQGMKVVSAPHVPMLREDNIRTGFFTREEVDRLCSFLRAPINAFVLFAFLTGWRKDEIRNLEWSNVNFDRGEIRLDAGTTKNRAGRVFPFTDELRVLLESLRQASGPTGLAGPEYVFSIDGHQIGEFRKTWKTACHRAGFPCELDAKGRVLKAQHIFHDLRRSFAREMDSSGIRQGAIMRLGGWKTDSVFRRYNIVSDSDLRDAIDKVNRRRE